MSLVPTGPQAPAAAHHVPAIRDTLTEGQMDVLRRTIAHDLTDDEFDLFAAVCRRTGLDPFKRQIWAVKRRTNQRKKERGQWVDNWVDVMQIQTGIDGYRTIAGRSGQYGGPTDAQWCGPDGQWSDVWLSSEPPAAARVGVIRHDFREPVYGVAIFTEFAATTGKDENKRLTGQWATMPAHMIAKCAEALAIRKAFPDDVAGVYTAEEMGQQDNRGAIDTGTPGIPARDFDELVAASAELDEAQLAEVKAWCAAEGIVLVRRELTSENAHRVMAKILELGRGGGGGDEPGLGSAAAPPPLENENPTQKGGGDDDSTGKGSPGPTAAAAAPGKSSSEVESEPPPARQGDGEASASPSPSGITADMLRAAVHAALPDRDTARKQEITASKLAAQVAGALSISFAGGFDDLVADQTLAAAVLADLRGDDKPPPSGGNGPVVGEQPPAQAPGSGPASADPAPTTAPTDNTTDARRKALARHAILAGECWGDDADRNRHHLITYMFGHPSAKDCTDTELGELNAQLVRIRDGRDELWLRANGEWTVRVRAGRGEAA